MMFSGAKSNEPGEWDSVRSLTLSEFPIGVEFKMETFFKLCVSQSLQYIKFRNGL